MGAEVDYQEADLKGVGSIAVTNGITASSFTGNSLIGNNVTSNGVIHNAKGADVASANDLTLGSDGNTFIITGNTQINAITTAQWSAGDKICLIFSGTPTVKHNTAGGVGTAVILLAGSVDLVAAANTILSLVYDGTQFQETSRKVA